MARNPVAGTSPLRRQKGQPQALRLEQIAAIRTAAADWRSEPGLPGPKPDGQFRDIIEVLLGTAMRPGEVLALRPCDLEDGPTGMVVSVTGTVVQHKGKGAVRQERPKAEASLRWIPVPEFAATVLRRRASGVPSERTIFANRSSGPLSPYNVRRTFREFLAVAGLADSGISLRWYRRTGATVIARGMGSDAAAVFLGHTSTAITEGHYIKRDRTIDRTLLPTWSAPSARTSPTAHCSPCPRQAVRTRLSPLSTVSRTTMRSRKEPTMSGRVGSVGKRAESPIPGQRLHGPGASDAQRC